MNRRRGRSRFDLQEGGWDFHGLIDVIFILLIFTMLAIQFDRFRFLELDFAQTDRVSKGTSPNQKILIQISETGDLFWNEEKISEQDLKDRLNQDKSIHRFVIACERKSEFQIFARVLEMIQSANPESIELALKSR
jgi:biopolymer transport protein ExbD